MKKIFCFGELLLRLSPMAAGQWIQEASMSAYLGGAELNVANALAGWELPVKYSSALPDNSLSGDIKAHLVTKKIDISAIHAIDGRIGVYFLPAGTDLKSAGVIYDREGSSFSKLKPRMINWEKVLEDCGWFHFSAISPALNEQVAAVCKEGLEVASRKGLTISVDLNYRSKLWNYGVSPTTVMPDLIKHCDVIMGNNWSAESLAGVRSIISSSEGVSDEQLQDAASVSMSEMKQRFSKAQCIAYTFRLPGKYWACMQLGSNFYRSGQYKILKTVDKAGSGDCFMAGLIYGHAHSMEPQETIQFATAAAVGKLQERGDATRQTVEMITQKMVSDGQ